MEDPTTLTIPSVWIPIFFASRSAAAASPSDVFRWASTSCSTSPAHCYSTSRRPSTPSSTPCSARFSSTAGTSRTSMCRCSSSRFPRLFHRAGGRAHRRQFSQKDLVNPFGFPAKTLCAAERLLFVYLTILKNHPCFLKHSRMFYCFFLSIVIALPQSFIMPQQCSSSEDTRHEKVPQRINNHQTPMRCGGIFSCLTSILKNSI